MKRPRAEEGVDGVVNGLDLLARSAAEGRTRMSDEREDTTLYRAVVNDEEQYSIWPADRELPLGWKDAGKTGLKREVLAWIEEVWTDMRPLSLRKKMEETQRDQGGEG
jgi:MbtH protein